MFNLTIKRKIILVVSVFALALCYIYGANLYTNNQTNDIGNMQDEAKALNDDIAELQIKYFEAKVSRLALVDNSLLKGQIDGEAKSKLLVAADEVTKQMNLVSDKLAKFKDHDHDLFVDLNKNWNSIINGIYPKLFDALEKRSSVDNVNNELTSQSVQFIEKIRKLNSQISKMYSNYNDQVTDLSESNRKKILYLMILLLVVVTPVVVRLIVSIIKPMNNLKANAEYLAKGDYSKNLEGGDQPDEIGTVIQSLNLSITAVRDTLKKVKQAAELVNSASSEIAVGSADLSGRTEQQAASLEETAASMESLTTTVKQNSDNASRASKLASEACSMADGGGAVMEKTIVAMGNIEKSSQKIADIITVIDEIAFQTNLLALNAAVEAARAGEAGKGFAVVASEVRALAGRSAAASKEIKDLILASNKEVENGSQMAAESGQKLKEIVESIKKVASIVLEINNASLEQSEGIGEVNVAISQMDEVTQQNAALVEESTAATQSLADQVHQLTSLLEYFKLGEASNEYKFKVAKVETKAVVKENKPVVKSQTPKASSDNYDNDWKEF